MPTLLAFSLLVTLLLAAPKASAYLVKHKPAGWVDNHLHGFRLHTNELLRSKCRPIIRFTLGADELPAKGTARRRFVRVVSKHRHVRATNASSSCNPVRPPATVALGRAMAAAVGWTGAQWDCLYDLFGRLESSWYVHADNPNSDAYGIPQALPGSKMGPGWQHSARVQIRWGLGYVRDRYGSPCEARSFRLANGWY